jgi:hypothetical protein
LLAGLFAVSLVSWFLIGLTTAGFGAAAVAACASAGWGCATAAAGFGAAGLRVPCGWHRWPL